MATGGGEDLMSDELVSNKCCVCFKKNKITEADRYCVECSNYYCTSCADIHTVVPHMEGHKLLDKTAFKSFRSDGTLPSFPTQRCSIHPSKVVDMYCQGHDEVACASCIALDHRSCNRIYSVPENVDNLYKRSEVTDLKLNFALNQKCLEDIKKSKEASVKQLQHSLNTSIDSVKTFCQELKSLLDKIENETIEELKREFDRIKTFLTKDMKEAEQLIDELKKVASQLRNAEQNKVQEFICTKMSKKLTTIGEKKMKHYQSQLRENISFTADQTITSFLQHIKVFGEVKCNTPSDTVAKNRLAVKPQSSVPNVTIPKTNLYKVTKQREINVKLQDDIYNCDIYGSCIMLDGSLLLADGNNNKLKRVDLSTEAVTDYLSLISSPIAVCQVSKTEAGVSLDNNTVQFVTLGDKLSASRTLTFNHFCQGLVFSNSKLFISDRGNSVYIHEMAGKELKKIRTDASGKDIFKNTRHIAISADGSRVFVADWDQGLITLDNHGNYLSTFSNREIQASGCCGVCTDGSNVFVCGYVSNDVVQKGKDHKLIGQIQRVGRPLSLCYNSQTNRLYVTKSVYSNDGGNTLLVLELT